MTTARTAARMRRRIVQHGPATLTISLPSEWVHRYHLKKGDEISIEALKDGLLLTTERERTAGKKTVDVRGVGALIEPVVAALYEAGYDTVELSYETPEELRAIHHIVNANYIGFAIIEETGTTVTAKKVTEPSPENFKAVFRRTGYSLLALADESLAIASGDHAAHGQAMMHYDELCNYAVFCRRVITHHAQQEFNQELSLYHLLEELERIADNYVAIVQLTHGPGKRDHAIAFHRRINTMLRAFLDMFFSFSLPKLLAFMTEYGPLREPTRDDQESLLVAKLRRIAQLILELEESVLIIRL